MQNDTESQIAEQQTPPPPVPTPPHRRGHGRGRGRRVGVWLARIVLAGCFLLAFYCSVFPGGRAAVRALTILPGILTATQPSWQQPVDEPITHTQSTLPATGGPVFLDIYTPVDAPPPLPGSREGMLIIIGVGDNRAVPQVVNLAETLAHAGLVAMVVTTPALINDVVTTDDEDAVVQAFHVLQHWPGVGVTRVGMFGISAGGALICLAAADARIRDQVAFVALLGSYFDVTTILEALGRRALDIDGKLVPWHPVPVPMQVIAHTVAPLLPNDDGPMLINAFVNSSTGTLTPAQIAQLAPESAALYHLLAGDQPGQVAENMAALPPALYALLASISPSSIVSQVRAPIYVLVARGDTFIPETEAREFATALAHLHHSYGFAEFGIFQQHAEVRSSLDLLQYLADGPNLFRLVSDVTGAST